MRNQIRIVLTRYAICCRNSWCMTNVSVMVPVHVDIRLYPLSMSFAMTRHKEKKTQQTATDEYMPQYMEDAKV